MTGKVLLAGSSYSAVPILQAMRARGRQVDVAGSVKGDPCHALAETSRYIDYSQREELLEVVQKNGYSFLCPSCNDFSYNACGWVAEQAGLPGYDPVETTTILHDKAAFREFTESKGFPVPRAFSDQTLKNLDAGSLPYPLLVKPVDSFSGRATTKVEHAANFSAAVEEARKESRGHRAVAETFIEGSLHSHSAFIRNGQVLVDFFVDEYCTVYPYQVDCSHSPSALSERLQSEVRACMQDLISSLRLTDGMLHTQFMVSGNDFWLIECMRRAPGDLYYKMIGLATGINGMDLYALPFLGESLPAEITPSRAAAIARHTVSVSKPVVPSSFSVDLECEELQIVALKPSGQVLEAAPYDKLAIFFARFSDLDRMFAVTPKPRRLRVDSMRRSRRRLARDLAQSRPV